jgi:UPF0755 protein
VANVPGSKRPQGTQRPAGTRFRTDAPAPSRQPARRPAQTGGTRFAQPSAAPASGRARATVQPAYTRSAKPAKSKSVVPVVIAVVIAIAVIAGAAFYVFPRLFGGAASFVEAGQQVTITIPEGSSGDAIASILSENHIIEEPSEYYAAVKKLNAEMSLKPGEYQFETLQDPLEVVKQLVAGPNVEGVKLTVPEGKTVEQTAAIVEQVYGISADEFVAQAKASNYAGDYAFLSEAADDSLEGFLFPKTYTFSGTPSADQVIRAMLDQYQTDVVNVLDFDAARALISSRYGLEMSNYDILKLASVVEREGLHAEQRAHVASVFFNRLAGVGDFAGRPFLESDATLMYETGGEVTANDIQTIDSPYNSYMNPGLPPTPICSPSIEAIRATLEPTDSSDLYFFITQEEEFFSQTYDEHMQSWE